MATAKNPNVFFVGISETKDLKRAVMESTRDTLVFLQKYSKFLEIKNQKNEAIDELKKVVREISNMVTKLKNNLPESEIHKRLGKEEISIEKEIIGIGVERKKVESEVSNKKATSRTGNKTQATKEGTDSQESKKPTNEMEQLEQQLKELENKLRQFE